MVPRPVSPPPGFSRSRSPVGFLAMSDSGKAAFMEEKDMWGEAT